MSTIQRLSARSLQYYAIARKWAADLEFFRFECRFLHQLIVDQQPRWLTEDDVRRFTEVVGQLQQLECDLGHTERLLDNQSRQLELMAEDVIPEDAEQVAAGQVRLEYLMSSMTGAFRNAKKMLYQLLSQQDDHPLLGKA